VGEGRKRPKLAKTLKDDHQGKGFEKRRKTGKGEYLIQRAVTANWGGEKDNMGVQLQTPMNNSNKRKRKPTENRNPSLGKRHISKQGEGKEKRLSLGCWGVR